MGLVKSVVLRGSIPKTLKPYILIQLGDGWQVWTKDSLDHLKRIHPGKPLMQWDTALIVLGGKNVQKGWVRLD